MAKFSGASVAPGQVTDEQAAVISGSPVADLQERTPQASGSAILQGVLEQQQQPEVAAPTQEEVAPVHEEFQRAQIPTIRERAVDDTRVDTYHRKGMPKPEADGGLLSRAGQMAQAVEQGSLTFSKQIDKADFDAVRQGQTPTYEASPTSLPSILSTVGAQQNALSPEGRQQTSYDPRFFAITSAVTENFLADTLVGEGADADTVQQNLGPGAEEFATGSEAGAVVTKAQGNAKLGRDIAAEYARTAGREPPQLSNEQATVLGDAAKEVYAQQNPDLVKRVSNGNGEQVYYQLTPEGQAKYDLGKADRKRLFPKQHVRPQKTPQGKLVGDIAGVRRNETGTVGRKGSRGKLPEAIENLNSIPNVVDMQRLRILYATALPVLADQQTELTPMFSEINNVGPGKARKFQAAERKAIQEGEQYSAADEMAKLKNNLAQSVYGIARERNGANYLTYYIQAYNGRLSPQQTHFDPTTSKAVRFVTRNATPSRISRGSRTDKNIRQMYAMMLVKGADTKLPGERERMLIAAEPKLKAWGKRLQEVLDGSIDADTAEAISAAIEQGVPITDPNFPTIPALALDPQADADLISAIASKGEDGPHFIDGLIDFANYHDAVVKGGGEYHSYFNAYIDGKTNGLAANGIQMGSEQVALTTGVIRHQNVDLLDDGDIRDQLKSVLLDELGQNGIAGVDPEVATEVNDIAKAVFGWRDLNKATTMTFGYGQEMSAFAGKIDETIGELYEISRSGDQELIARHGLETFADSLDTWNEQAAEPAILSETLLRPYSAALTQVLSEEGIKSRALMKGSATIHALAGEVFHIKTYSGMDLNFGGDVTTGIEETQSYQVDGKSRTAPIYGKRATAAAVKQGTDQIGRKAIGGSVPGPVQSLDAETIALSVTGKSWDKLKKASGGNPYFHSIYDAIKMDANGYDVVLEEVNNNWLKAAMEWSYLKEMYKSTQKTVKALDEELKALGDAEVDTTPTGKYAMTGYLLSLEASQKGNMIPKKLFSALKSTLWQKPGETSDQFNDRVWGIVFSMKDKYKQYFTPDGGPDTMPAHVVREFFKDYLKINNMGDRFRGMIEQTENNKKALAKKIRSSGPVYQYYAH